MDISKEQVLNIATLSRLRFAEEEVEGYANALSDILTYVELLNTVDTDGVEPTTHAVPTAMRFREDEVEARLTQQDCLANAPASQDGMFQVPKVISDS